MLKASAQSRVELPYAEKEEGEQYSAQRQPPEFPPARLERRDEEGREEERDDGEDGLLLRKGIAPPIFDPLINDSIQPCLYCDLPHSTRVWVIRMEYRVTAAETTAATGELPVMVGALPRIAEG